ncbi:MAG: hypothetical protein ACI4XL_07230 [Bacillus sp. (in: firmicutes)]
MMIYNDLKNNVYKTYNDSGVFPTHIKINKDLLIALKEAGYIGICPQNPTKITFLGVEVEPDSTIPTYEIY